MANNSIQLSFGDLLKGIIQEFSSALRLMRQNYPAVHVHRVKLNIGQDHQEKTGDPIESPSSLIVADRYQRLDTGWLMEVELGESVSARVGAQVYEQPNAPDLSALDLFGDMPLTAIKGIDDKWNKIFSRAGIRRISQLAGMNDPALLQLIRRSHDLRPREFRRKAQLLEARLPVISSRAASSPRTLYELLFLSAEELQRALGGVSRIETYELLDFIELLNVTLDSEQLRAITLGQIFEG